MTSEPPRPQPQDASPIGCLIAVVACVDFLAIPIIAASDSEVLEGIVLGALAAQLGLAAIWAVLGPQRWIVRLPLTLMVTLLLFGALFIGGIPSQSPPPPDIILQGLLLPVIFLAVQLPLWILRIATGWRIVFTSPRPSAQRTSTASAQAAPESQPEAPEATDGSVPASGSRQFRIEHILGAMAVIAIALGLARVAVIHETFPGGNVDAWTSLLVACAFCCIWSALSTLPCLWAAFSAPEKGAAAIAIGGYTVFMTLIAAAILGGGGFLEAAGMLLLFNGTLAAVMLGILHVARACGYALLRPGRPVQRPAPADPPDRNEIGKPSPPADPPPSL